VCRVGPDPAILVDADQAPPHLDLFAEQAEYLGGEVGIIAGHGGEVVEIDDICAHGRLRTAGDRMAADGCRLAKRNFRK